MKSRKSARPSGSGFRKTLQLCKQVERTLNQVLSGECDDDVLRELLVVGVEPLQGTSQLLVTLQPFDPGDSPAVPQILEHLHRAKNHLREAVAETVSRRKMPDLLFQISATESV